MYRAAGPLLLLCFAAGWLHTSWAVPTDFTSPGPCRVDKLVLPPFQIPKQACSGWFCTLGVRLHLPAAAANGNWTCFPAPHPIVLLLPGFSLSSTYYVHLARHLASYGFAVLQYNHLASWLNLASVQDEASMAGWDGSAGGGPAQCPAAEAACVAVYRHHSASPPPGPLCPIYRYATGWVPALPAAVCSSTPTRGG
jgi:hypothetical protein